jgi:hypothetical protein
MRRFLAAVLCSALLTTVSTSRPAYADHGPQWIICLPTCTEWTRFTNYDYRQNGWGSVDWPTGFFFMQNASRNSVRNGICSLTTHSWKYCATGRRSVHVRGTDLQRGPGDRRRVCSHVADSGRKRFTQNCTNNEWTAHMRIYGPPGIPGGNSYFYDLQRGFQVAATTHLDYRDQGGCAGRTHGYSEIAENWMIGTMNAIPGWSVQYNTWGLGNSNTGPAHTVDRTLSGVQVPHIYDNDGWATTVVVN